MLSTVLGAFYSQQGRCYHCPHLADEETEACRRSLIWPRQQLFMRPRDKTCRCLLQFQRPSSAQPSPRPIPGTAQKSVCNTIPRQPWHHFEKHGPTNLEVSKGEESPMGLGSGPL